MEYYRCSVSGVKIVYMTIHWICEKTGANISKCEHCGKEEITGFGYIN